MTIGDFVVTVLGVASVSTIIIYIIRIFSDLE